jgi:hypothetical protein
MDGSRCLRLQGGNHQGRLAGRRHDQGACPRHLVPGDWRPPYPASTREECASSVTQQLWVLHAHEVSHVERASGALGGLHTDCCMQVLPCYAPTDR